MKNKQTTTIKTWISVGVAVALIGLLGMVFPGSPVGKREFACVLFDIPAAEREIEEGVLVYESGTVGIYISWLSHESLLAPADPENVRVHIDLYDGSPGHYLYADWFGVWEKVDMSVMEIPSYWIDTMFGNIVNKIELSPTEPTIIRVCSRLELELPPLSEFAAEANPLRLIGARLNSENRQMWRLKWKGPVARVNPRKGSVEMGRLKK